MRHWAVLALFLFVTYPTIKVMTKLKGRSWMFKWRHQLFHRCGGDV
ncbi:hypothetical protein HOV23_gp097 [Pseudomonas phage Lana]|uniref:Uncharacterized protein n=1 Tax=Pseudomonas phage Lana TaxID=2530172 RepID=A0A481W5W5_9CAUD|nr:hypothetical protein HOV23_gp097 [Pseudomonas phage Lana]QBJ04476.1 hypothetical protein [Pseudomonas phage Lana]